MNTEDLLRKIAAKILTDEDLRKTFSTPLGITVTGDRNKSWLISSDLKEVTPEEASEARLSVELNEKDLHDLIDGSANPQALFIQGKLKVKGDISLAFKLHKAFGVTET